MRFALAAGLVLAGLSRPGFAARILLVPLDDRPASSHFAQLIGDIANIRVELPPREMLGHFTTPGNPEAILNWLDSQDYSDVLAVVVNTDMIGYGGLIASRVPDTGYRLAIERIRGLWRIRRNHAWTPFYAFSAIMRLHPTALKATAAWRLALGRYVEVEAQHRVRPTPELGALLERLARQVPADELARYRETRQRNHMVQRELVRMVSFGVFDYLILGQDDARPQGPHIAETQKLRSMVANLRISDKVYFCEGIDQHSNVLVSRALMREMSWSPRVRVIYSDELGKKKIANYEAKPIEQSLREQMLASGASPTVGEADYDYTLYINTPEPRYSQFQRFLTALANEIDQGFPVAVADINLGKTGVGDDALLGALLSRSRIVRLLAYAGWNTAGNTLGTALPAANVYLLSRRMGLDPLRRELAQRTFILHRIVDDFEYHKFTRPEAYRLIDSLPGASREETYGQSLAVVDSFVKQDLSRRLEAVFRDQFLGRRFFAGGRQYLFSGLENVQVALPWPRAYEVSLNFRIAVTEAPVAEAQPGPSPPAGGHRLP